MMKTRSKARPAGPQPSPEAAPLPHPERAELQRQGAKAAARGENAASNPLHEPQNLPAATGESADTWQLRQEAWRQGHDVQSGTPGAKSPPATPQESDDGHK